MLLILLVVLLCSTCIVEVPFFLDNLLLSPSVILIKHTHILLQLSEQAVLLVLQGLQIGFQLTELLFELIQRHRVLFSLGFLLSFQPFLDGILLKLLFELLSLPHDMILQCGLHRWIPFDRWLLDNHFGVHSNVLNILSYQNLKQLNLQNYPGNKQ